MIRRILAVCLAALLLWPAAGLGEMPLVYPQETVVSVMPLTQTQRRLAEYLYVPVLEGTKKISLPEGTRYDDVGPAMQSLMLDFPEMFHLGRTYTISYWQNEPGVAVSVSPDYRMDARQADRLRQQMYDAAMTLIRQDGSALGLHDAVVSSVVYGGSTEMRHTAVGALLQGQATCEGYAQALSLLYRMAGIPCGVVSGVAEQRGSSESHAWNVAWLNGYTLIDATWNDQDNSGYNTRWYFGLSSAQMGRDHTPDAKMNLPECGDQASWHRATGRYASSQEDVFGAVYALVTYGEPVNLRVTDAALYRRISSDPGSMLDAYNEWCPADSAFYGAYTYMTCDEQQCIIITRSDR